MTSRGTRCKNSRPIYRRKLLKPARDLRAHFIRCAATSSRRHLNGPAVSPPSSATGGDNGEGTPRAAREASRGRRHSALLAVRVEPLLHILGGRRVERRHADPECRSDGTAFRCIWGQCKGYGVVRAKFCSDLRPSATVSLLCQVDSLKEPA